jgi:hypothetical protein
MKKIIFTLILLYSLKGFTQFTGSSQLIYQRTIGETNKYIESSVGLELGLGYEFNNKLEAYIKPNISKNVTIDLSANYYLTTKRIRPYVMLAGVYVIVNNGAGEGQKLIGIKPGIGVEWERNMYLELSFLSAGKITKEGDFNNSTLSYNQVSIPFNMISFGIGYRLKPVFENLKKRKIQKEKLKILDLKDKNL